MKKNVKEPNFYGLMVTFFSRYYKRLAHTGIVNFLLHLIALKLQKFSHFIELNLKKFV